MFHVNRPVRVRFFFVDTFDKDVATGINQKIFKVLGEEVGYLINDVAFADATEINEEVAGLGCGERHWVEDEFRK